MVAFPEKTGEERREGPYTGQNPHLPRPTATTPVTSLPWWGPLKISKFPGCGKAISIPRSFPTRSWNGSMAPSTPPLQKHLPPDGSYPTTSESLAGKAPKEGILRGVSLRDVPFDLPRKNGQGTGSHGFGDQALRAKGDPRVLAFWWGRRKCPELAGGFQGSQRMWGAEGADLH